MPMNSIGKWFTTSVSQSRMTSIDGTHEAYSVIHTSIMCTIQEYEPSRKVTAGKTLYKLYRMYCPVTTDLREEDTIFDGVYNYTIKGVLKRSEGQNPHIEAMIDRSETQSDSS